MLLCTLKNKVGNTKGYPIIHLERDLNYTHNISYEFVLSGAQIHICTYAYETFGCSIRVFGLQKTTRFIVDIPSSVSVNNLSLLCSILSSWMRFHINYLKNCTCHWMKVFSNEYLQPFLNKNPTVGKMGNNIRNVHTILTSIEIN